MLVVCGPISSFGDDVWTTCADCSAAIVHRPHVPEPSTKVCLSCATKRVGPHARVRVTEETLRELALYRSRTKGVQ